MSQPSDNSESTEPPNPGLTGLTSHHENRKAIRGNGYFKRLGPGLLTGAADDDPSGIATYSQVGAALGLSLTWITFAILPLALAVQEAVARLALVSGKGLGTLIRERFPRWIGIPAIALVAMANIMNIGADLGSIAAAIHMLIPIPVMLSVVALGSGIAFIEVVVPYHKASRVLRWFALTLLTYVAVMFVIHVDWKDVAHNSIWPRNAWNRTTITAIVAILGTTISPYLFFWQAGEEVEERAMDPSPVDDNHLKAMRFDVSGGMISGVATMFAIMTVAAMTLGKAGITQVTTAEEAAMALEPIAGKFAKVLFAFGIIGLGLLAIPVLAGATAYAVAEMMRWREGLENRPTEAKHFYGVVVVATGIGIAMNFANINPMRALYLSAIGNGLVAPPLIVLILILGRSKEVLGTRRFGAITQSLLFVGALAMGLAAVATLYLSFR